MTERFGFWALVVFVLGTPLLVEFLKAALPKRVKGLEKWLAMALPLAASVAMKLLGLFRATPVEETVAWAVLSGLLGQVVHDKIPKPAFLGGIVARLLGRGGAPKGGGQ